MTRISATSGIDGFRDSRLPLGAVNGGPCIHPVPRWSHGPGSGAPWRRRSSKRPDAGDRGFTGEGGGGSPWNGLQ